MTLLLVVVAIGIVLGVAVLVARDRPVLADDPVDPRTLHWPPDGGLTPQDLVEARFTVALRGYRMDEVDRVLDDARAALADRDRRIAALERVGSPDVGDESGIGVIRSDDRWLAPRAVPAADVEPTEPTPSEEHAPGGPAHPAEETPLVEPTPFVEPAQ